MHLVRAFPVSWSIALATIATNVGLIIGRCL